MSKLNFISSIILSISIALSGYFIGQTYVEGRKLDRVVKVKGLAEREVQADIATWPLELTVSGNDLGKLQQMVEKQTKVLRDFFTELEFSDSELTIGAPNLIDNETSLYISENSSYKDRYIINIEFNLRTTKLNKMSDAIFKFPSIIGKGLVISSKNSWAPIQYRYTKLNEIKPEMIEEATKNAREAAEKFARDSGSKVGKIKSANQGLFSISDLESNPNGGTMKKVRIVSTLHFYIED